MTKKKKNEEPTEYAEILTQKPVERERIFPINQANKKRRANFTIFVIQSILGWYGTVSNFLVCMDELREYTEKAADGDKLNFVFPEDLKNLSVTKEKVLQDLKIELRPHCGTLLTLGRFTRTQFNLIRKYIPHLPCWKTVRRDENNQKNIADEIDEDFFVHLEEGIRKFWEYNSNSENYFISMKNIIRWMLFLVGDVMEEQFEDYTCVKMNFDFALWADGGKMYGGIKGLFSALKMVAPVFYDGSDKKIFVEHENIRWLLSRAWMMEIRNHGETTEAVRKLEKDQIKQYLDHVKDKEFKHGKFVLKARLIGWCTDHGYRLKSLGKDNLSRCCGECDFSKEPKDGSSFHFVNQEYLLSLQEVTASNWYSIRYKEMPDYLEEVEEAEVSLFSYDNHHNVVGHIKKIYSVLHKKVPKDKIEIVDKRSVSIVGIDLTEIEKQKDNSLTRVWPFKGWQWRLLSLHFKEIFADIFDPIYEKQLFVLFGLLNEIHMVNYMHFDRTLADFSLIIERYWIIITCYGIQLQLLFPNDAKDLDDLYLHKILVHSPRIFVKYNLAMYSCEQGEGAISISNRVARANGVCRESKLTMLNVLKYHILSQENMSVMAETPSSRVWKQVELELFKYKVMIPGCSSIKSIISALVTKKHKYSFLKDFEASEYLKGVTTSDKFLISNEIITYSSQLAHLPSTILFSTDNSQIKISIDNKVRLDPGEPDRTVTAVTDDVNLYLKQISIKKKHELHLDQFQKNLEVNKKKFKGVADAWDLIESSKVKLLNEVNLLGDAVKKENCSVQISALEESKIHDFVGEFYETLQGKHLKSENFDKIWKYQQEFFLDNELFTKIVEIEKNSIDLLHSVSGVLNSGVDSNLFDFYSEHLCPHVTLHFNILENTKLIINDLSEALWKPIYKQSLIEKKDIDIQKLKTKSKYSKGSWMLNSN